MAVSALSIPHTQIAGRHSLRSAPRHQRLAGLLRGGGELCRADHAEHPTALLKSLETASLRQPESGAAVAYGALARRSRDRLDPPLSPLNIAKGSFGAERSRTSGIGVSASGGRTARALGAPRLGRPRRATGGRLSPPSFTGRLRQDASDLKAVVVACRCQSSFSAKLQHHLRTVS